jgi:ABC-type amino acid transport system permease subunit
MENMYLTQAAAEVVQKVKNCSLYSGLVIDEITRIGQKLSNNQALNRFEISLLEIVRESVEFDCSSREEE